MCVCVCVCVHLLMCVLCSRTTQEVSSEVVSKQETQVRAVFSCTPYSMCLPFPSPSSPLLFLPGRVSTFLPLSSGAMWQLTLCPLNFASSPHITQRRQRTKTPSLPYWSNTRSDTLTHILIHSYSHFHFQEGPDWIHHEDWILLKE